MKQVSRDLASIVDAALSHEAAAHLIDRARLIVIILKGNGQLYQQADLMLGFDRITDAVKRDQVLDRLPQRN